MQYNRHHLYYTKKKKKNWEEKKKINNPGGLLLYNLGRNKEKRQVINNSFLNRYFKSCEIEGNIEVLSKRLCDFQNYVTGEWTKPKNIIAQVENAVEAGYGEIILIAFIEQEKPKYLKEFLCVKNLKEVQRKYGKVSTKQLWERKLVGMTGTCTPRSSTS